MADTLTLSVRHSFKQLEKDLDAFARKQVPFVQAKALTGIAKRVQAAEQRAMKKTLDRPTPFTVRSVAVRGANKNSQTAIVYLRDIAAAYLKPFIEGGRHKLNSRALLNPKNLGLNKYGNIPRNKIVRLKGRSDIFIGAVKTKGGTVNGVWQRMRAAKGKPSHLKLLIRFGDAQEVTQHLDWYGTARTTITQALVTQEFDVALTGALKTAKR